MKNIITVLLIITTIVIADQCHEKCDNNYSACLAECMTEGGCIVACALELSICWSNCPNSTSTDSKTCESAAGQWTGTINVSEFPCFCKGPTDAKITTNGISNITMSLSYHDIDCSASKVQCLCCNLPTLNGSCEDGNIQFYGPDMLCNGSVDSQKLFLQCSEQAQKGLTFNLNKLK